MADLLGVLESRGTAVSAIVHEHRLQTQGTAEHAGDTRVPIYRVPSLGRLLYAPVSPAFPVWLRRAIRSERPDLLHLHVPNTSAFWALASPEARRIPWIVQWQSDVVSSSLDRRLKLAYPLYRPFEQSLLRRAAKVVVASPTYLAGSRALAPWRDKCRVVPLGLDPARISDVPVEMIDEAQRWWGDARFRILSVGRLTYYKGQEYLVRAMRHVPSACALIVGEGERRRTLETVISGMDLDKRVVLTGKLPSERLHALMKTCDCLCLPSIERTEAFGLVLLEAMAHGKPAVVCDIPGSGVNWVVQEGKTGRVVPPADAEALSGAFQGLSADRETLHRMGHEARRRYENEFRIDRVVEEIQHLYRETLNL